MEIVIAMLNCFFLQPHTHTHPSCVFFSSYLNLDGPAEVGHVDVEGDVVMISEVKLFAGETVSVLLDVGSRYDRHLFTRDGTSCERQT